MSNMPIVNGIDFGGYKQLGLEKLNVPHEQAMIGLLQHHVKVMKVLPTTVWR